MSLTQTVSGFMQGNGFYIISTSDSPCKSIVVIDLSKCYICFSVVVQVCWISGIIRKNDCVRNGKDECATSSLNSFKECCWQPSCMYYVGCIIKASTKTQKETNKASRYCWVRGHLKHAEVRANNIVPGLHGT